MKYLVRGTVMLAGFVLASWAGINVLLLGIGNMGDGFKSTPTDSWQVLVGIVQVFTLAELVFVIILFITFAVVFGSSASRGRLPYRRKTSRQIEFEWERRMRESRGEDVN